MSAAQLDGLAAAATKRLVEHINRIAGQHKRRMLESWRARA